MMTPLLILAALTAPIEVPFSGRVTFTIPRGEAIDIVPGDRVEGTLSYEPVEGFLDGSFRKFDVPAGVMSYRIEDFAVTHLGWKHVTGNDLFQLRATNPALLDGDGRDVLTSQITIADGARWGSLDIVDGPFIEFSIDQPVIIPEPPGLKLLVGAIAFLFITRGFRK